MSELPCGLRSWIGPAEKGGVANGSRNERADCGRRMTEPVGSVDPPLRFVVHEHYATTHHFDLRLEREGTLWSWAVPKGMPTDPTRNRLAIRVENHDLDHIDYEDRTPVDSSNPDIVRKSIWDRGTYTTVTVTPRKLVVDLSGSRLNDRFAVFQTGDRNWMIHLMAS